jgi:hypothetical protein
MLRRGMTGGFGNLYRRYPVLFGGLLWGFSLVIVDVVSAVVRGRGFRPGDLPVSLVIALLVGWLVAWMINR